MVGLQGSDSCIRRQRPHQGDWKQKLMDLSA
jgi:hypothetical protein